MTKKGRFKKLVRARMAQTGEPYRTARARLLGRPRPQQQTHGGAGMYPFERFTEKAKRALQLAQQEAEQSRHSYIGTEHLLIALLLVPDGMAARVLAELGVDVDAVRSRISALLARNERVALKQIIPTSRVKKVIDISFEQARDMGHNYVGTEHLLLGIQLEGEGIAAKILDDLGAPLDAVRPLVERFVAEGRPVESDAAGSGPLRLSPEVIEVIARARALATAAGAESVGLDQLRAALDA